MNGVLFRVARFAEAFILTEEPEGEAMAIKGYLNAAGALPIAAALLLGACTTVTLKGDEDEPIVVNLNVKIDQEVRVKLDKEIEDLIAENPDIF